MSANDKKKSDSDVLEVLEGENYGVTEVAQMLGVSRTKVMEILHLGELTHFSIAERRTIVTKKELIRYLNRTKNIKNIKEI